MKLPVKIIISAVLIASAVGFYIHRENEKEARQVILNSATELPSGVRAQWHQTLEKALKEKVEISGMRILMPGYAGVKMVPLNQVSVECTSFSVSLQELGESGESLVLLGRGISVNRGLPMPPLGVGSTSPAARQLYKEICLRLSGWLESIK